MRFFSRVPKIPAILAFCALTTTLAPAAEATTTVPPETITIAYENSTQFPYYIGDSQNIPENPGVAVEMVLALQEILPGTRIELLRFPWKRCLALLESGQVDAIFNASFTEERDRFALYPRLSNGEIDNSRRLTSISYSWYTTSLNNAEQITTDKLIAAPAGYSIVKQLENQGYQTTLPPNSLSALRMLSAGRVEAAALQSVTGNYLLATQQSFAEIQRLDPPIVDKAYFLIFSQSFYQRYPYLTEDLWNYLGDLRDTRMPGLIERYLDPKEPAK